MKCSSSVLLAWRPPAFHSRILRESGGGKRKQEVWRNSQEHEAVVRVQWEKILSGRKGDRRFEDKGKRECCIRRRVTILKSESIRAGKVRGGRLVGVGTSEEVGGSSRSESCEEF